MNSIVLDRLGKFVEDLACLGTRKVMLGSIALYLTPKALSTLCSQPKQLPPVERIDKIREKMSIFKEKTRSLIGEKNWFAVTKIIGDNAWISYLALTYLTQGAPLFVSFESGLKEAYAFLGICAMSSLFSYYKDCLIRGIYGS